MSLTLPGVQLKKEDKKKRNFDRCILCQKVNDSKGDKKLWTGQHYCFRRESCYWNSRWWKTER